MSQQLNMEKLFGDNIMALGEPHMACALLLDVSGSMYGKAIKSLNEGIRRFKGQVCADSVARQRVDIALITFSDKVEVVSDFVSIASMPTPELKAGGCTMMAAGIQTAIDKVKERTRYYQQLGTPAHKPWIFMITDGMATDQANLPQMAQLIEFEENKGSHGRLAFWALGVGDYESSDMFTLTKRVVELKNKDFTNTFDWLSESMAIISQSRVDEKIAYPNLREDMRKAERDRKIDEDW